LSVWGERGSFKCHPPGRAVRADYWPSWLSTRLSCCLADSTSFPFGVEAI
jgi:hypothetical protein